MRKVNWSVAAKLFLEIAILVLLVATAVNVCVDRSSRDVASNEVAWEK